MQLEKRFKPTHHKANARYRGVTEHAQYTNFVQETAHDLLLLSHLKTGNEKTDRLGHEKEIEQNFRAVMTGDGDVAKTRLFKVAKLQKLDRSRTVDMAPLPNWELVNNTTKVTEGNGLRLSDSGLKTPAGALTRLYVEAGDRLYLRMKVRSETGAPNFSFGSSNMRMGPGEYGNLKEVPLAAGEEYVVVDHILEVRHNESITLNLNLFTSPDFLTATKVQVRDLECYYLNEQGVQAAGYHDVVKPRIDAIEETINSIK